MHRLLSCMKSYRNAFSVGLSSPRENGLLEKGLTCFCSLGPNPRALFAIESPKNTAQQLSTGHSSRANDCFQLFISVGYCCFQEKWRWSQILSSRRTHTEEKCLFPGMVAHTYDRITQKAEAGDVTSEASQGCIGRPSLTVDGN